MQEVAAQPMDHDDGRLAAAQVDIVDALTVDLDELAARRQHRLDAARWPRRKPDQTGDDERQQQDQSEQEGHGKLPSSEFIRRISLASEARARPSRAPAWHSRSFG